MPLRCRRSLIQVKSPLGKLNNALALRDCPTSAPVRQIGDPRLTASHSSAKSRLRPVYRAERTCCRFIVSGGRCMVCG